MTRARAAQAQWLWVAPLALALAVLACTAWAYLSNAYAYVDNGDGLYLYPARRLAQGATLYREAVATQPPLVYALAALVFKAGWGVPGVRLLSVLMRVLCVASVYLLGARLFARRIVGSLAALLYALLPIGLTWDHWDNSNSPLTLVALLSAYALLRLSPRAAVVSGLLAALALFTKDLYLPLLAATLLYLWRVRRALLASYLAALLTGVGLLSLLLVLYGGVGAWRDAFLGQDSSPLNGDWLVASLAYVATLEGGFIVAAAVGAVLCLYPSPPTPLPRAGQPSLPTPLPRAGQPSLPTPLSALGQPSPPTPLPCAGEGSNGNGSLARKPPGSAGVPPAPAVDQGWARRPRSHFTLNLRASHNSLAILTDGTTGSASIPPVGARVDRMPASSGHLCANDHAQAYDPKPDQEIYDVRGARLFAPYLLAGSVAVLLATLKEGTFGTVFALAEPAVALLAAFTIVRAVQTIGARRRHAPLWAGVLALACVSCLGLIGPDRDALFTSAASNANAAAARDVVALIRRHAAPRTVVLAPPYYAVLTGTRLPYDISDTYILAQRAKHGDPAAVAWVRGMAQAVAHGRYPVVVVDRHIALFAPVMAALRRVYHPVYADTLPLSVQSVVWLPGRAGERPSSACPPFSCPHSGFRMWGLPRRQ